ncbi:replisome organizer bipartite natively.4A [Caudoviricetes sp.]|nr:replisome organizer bipartite natively.4A [Caudoviricetes sp.]
MIESDFQPAMKELADFFNKNLAAIQYDIWFRKVRFLNAKTFRTAVNDVMGSEKYFPTPKTLLEYAAKYRENEEFLENKTAPKVSSLSRTSPKDSEYVLECKEIFGLVCRGQLTGKVLNDCAASMAQKYPHKGWEGFRAYNT